MQAARRGSLKLLILRQLEPARNLVGGAILKQQEPARTLGGAVTFKLLHELAAVFPNFTAKPILEPDPLKKHC